MRKSYDFQEASQGSVTKVLPGKTRITIRLDNGVIEWFKEQVHLAGGGSYQRLINDALREHILKSEEPLEETLRRVVREERQHTD